MNNTTPTISSAGYILLIAIACMSFSSASAQEEHRAYRHALADLRGARWLIMQHDDSTPPSAEELAAVHTIELSVSAIIGASIDDGLYYKDRPEVTDIDIADRDGRLVRALELLRKAHADINHEQSDDFGKGLKVHSLTRIDEAVRLIEKMETDKHKDIVVHL